MTRFAMVADAGQGKLRQAMFVGTLRRARYEGYANFWSWKEDVGEVSCFDQITSFVAGARCSSCSRRSGLP